MLQENINSSQARDEAETELRLAQSELKVARENKELARIELAHAQEQLAMRSISSPFDGVVVDRMINPGELAESGSGRKPLQKLAQIDVLRVDAVLPAALFGKVRAGQRVTVIPQGSSGRHAAAVKAVDWVVDGASGTFVARIELPNRDGAVPSGVRCRVEIQGVQGPGP
jgi:multidrug efflux pump subunit AcrA (membrane-fusion protein)